MAKSIILLLLTLCLGSLSQAQRPKLTNAQVKEVAVAGGLQSTVNSIMQKQEGPAWIGYRIPTMPKERGTWNCTSVESDGNRSFADCASNCDPPEPLRHAFVFLRLEQKQIGKVRAYTADCGLDFANLPFYWLENVNPSESVTLLANLSLATAPEAAGKKSDLPDHAIMAIALHDDPSADLTLEKLIQPGQPEHTRERVAFWLGVERGKKGFEILRKYVKNDPNEQFRSKAVFALSQSKEPEALREVISIARSDASAHVRGQAIFWLGQIGGRKEAEQITAAIENDPETEVKKRAVFALAQMHNGEGIPLLINIAKTNKNPVVRKEAIRWLGMTNDPRALDYLEEILTK